MHQRIQTAARVGRHAQGVGRESSALLVEQAQHHAFAVAAGQRRHAHVDRAAAQAQQDAAVLRQPFLGDVEVGHDLDARDQRGVQAAAGPHDIAQGAIDAVAHHRVALERLDVDVGGAFAQRLRQQRVEHADDRRVVTDIEQVFDLGDVLKQAREIDLAFHFDHHRRGLGAVVDIGRAQPGLELLVRHQQRRHVARE